MKIFYCTDQSLRRYVGKPKRKIMLSYEDSWPEELFAVAYNDIMPNFRIKGTYFETLEAAIYYAKLMPGTTKIHSVMYSYESPLMWTDYSDHSAVTRYFRTLKEAEICSVLMGGLNLIPRRGDSTDIAAIVMSDKVAAKGYTLIAGDLNITVSVPYKAYEFIGHIGGPVKLIKDAPDPPKSLQKRKISDQVYDD